MEIVRPTNVSLPPHDTCLVGAVGRVAGIACFPTETIDEAEAVAGFVYACSGHCLLALGTGVVFVKRTTTDDQMQVRSSPAIGNKCFEIAESYLGRSCCSGGYPGSIEIDRKIS